MKIKHKIIKDFPYVSPDKKITLLKSGAILEDFIYRTKTESLLLDRDVVNSNSDFFQNIDWKQDLLGFMKQNKIPQPSVIGKKIIPFIEDMFVMNIVSQANSSDTEKEFKEKLQTLSLKEQELESENKKRRRELDEMEKNIESKLTQMEIDMEKKYRSKMKEVSTLESDLQEKMLEIHRSNNTNNGKDYDTELQNLKKEFQIKELELQKKSELQLTESQVSLEKNYREKILEVMQKESELEIKTGRLNQRQQDYENSMKKLSLKEQEIRDSFEEIAKKQEELRDFEYKLNQQERDFDKTSLQNTKDMDNKMKEMNDRLQVKLNDLEKREADLNIKMEALNQKETRDRKSVV